MDPALTKLSILMTLSSEKRPGSIDSYTAGCSQYVQVHYWHHALYSPRVLHFSAFDLSQCLNTRSFIP